MQPFKTTAKSVFNCYVCCSLWLSLLAGVQCGSSASSSNRPGPLKFLFVPLLGNSPAIDMMGVAAELRSRGHAVAVVAVPAALPFMRQAVARYSDDATAELVEYIAADLGMPAREAAPEQMKGAQRTSKPYQQRFTVPQSRLRFLTVGLQLLLTIQDNAAGPCSKVLADPALLQRLRSFAPHAVLALGLPVASGAASDSCGCLLSHALGAPLIDLMGVVWTGPSSTPQFGSGVTVADLQTASGYLHNLATWAVLQLRPLLAALRTDPWLSARQQLGLPGVSTSCPLANAVAWLKGVRRFEKCEGVLDVVLASWVLEHPRGLQPNQVLVGPGTPRPAQPISSPPDVAAFIASAQPLSANDNANINKNKATGSSGGLIFVAFGTSLAFISWLSREDFVQLALGFGALAPARVLWNLQEAGLPHGLKLADLPLADNTKVVDWVDYNDVLGHPATLLLVSHCGLHSIYEAAFHGVPVVGLPFMFEQADNCMKLAARGAAVLSQQAPAFRCYNDSGASSSSYSSQHLVQLIKQVLHTPGYAAAARRLSGALQAYAAARHPYKRAADEMELALHSRHAQQLQALSSDMEAGRPQQHSGKQAVLDPTTDRQETHQPQQDYQHQPADMLEPRLVEGEQGSGTQQPLEDSAGRTGSADGGRDQQEL